MISLLYLAGITQITRTLQSICRDRTRALKLSAMRCRSQPTLPIP